MNEISDLVAETAGSLARVEEFFPRRFLRNGHLQTLIGNFKPRQYVLPEPESHFIEVDPRKGFPRREQDFELKGRSSRAGAGRSPCTRR